MGHRGFWNTLLHIPTAAVRPMVLAVRTRASAKKARRLADAQKPVLLHLGSGTERLEGWVDVDLYFPADLCLDLTRPLPIPDACVDAIYSQHFIEHIEKEQTAGLLGECARILRPGGRVRISTPDLEAHVRRYLQSLDTGAPDQSGQTAADTLNAAMRAHDHLYLYDYPTLAGLFADAGLIEITRPAPQASPSPHLQNMETRLPDPQNHRDLIIEAQKPE